MSAASTPSVDVARTVPRLMSDALARVLGVPLGLDLAAERPGIGA